MTLLLCVVGKIMGAESLFLALSVRLLIRFSNAFFKVFCFMAVWYISQTFCDMLSGELKITAPTREDLCLLSLGYTLINLRLRQCTHVTIVWDQTMQFQKMQLLMCSNYGHRNLECNCILAFRILHYSVTILSNTSCCVRLVCVWSSNIKSHWDRSPNLSK